MRTYTKPLAEVLELRVTENIAASKSSIAGTVRKKWNAVGARITNEYNILTQAVSE